MDRFLLWTNKTVNKHGQNARQQQNRKAKENQKTETSRGTNYKLKIECEFIILLALGQSHKMYCNCPCRVET